MTKYPTVVRAEISVQTVNTSWNALIQISFFGCEILIFLSDFSL